MARTINIPGRLHSVAMGNILVGAFEVYDDSKKKNQQLLNAEVAQALALARQDITNLQSESGLVQQLADALREAGETDLAEVILQTAQLNTRINNLNTALDNLSTQLNGLSLTVLDENEYETLVTNDDVDADTLYFVTEAEIE